MKEQSKNFLAMFFNKIEIRIKFLLKFNISSSICYLLFVSFFAIYFTQACQSVSVKDNSNETLSEDQSKLNDKNDQNDQNNQNNTTSTSLTDTSNSFDPKPSLTSTSDNISNRDVVGESKINEELNMSFENLKDFQDTQVDETVGKEEVANADTDNGDNKNEDQNLESVQEEDKKETLTNINNVNNIDSLIEQQDYTLAINTMKDYLSSNPKDLSVMYKLALTYNICKDYKQALVTSSKLSELVDSDIMLQKELKYKLLHVQILINLASEVSEGDFSYSNEDYKLRAYEELKQINKYQTSIEAYVLLSRLYIIDHKYQGARYLLKAALDHYLATSDSNQVSSSFDYPGYNYQNKLDALSSIYLYLAYLDINDKQYNQAVSNLNQIDQNYQNNLDVLYVYGTCYLSSNQLQKASTYIDKLLLSEDSFRSNYLKISLLKRLNADLYNDVDSSSNVALSLAKDIHEDSSADSNTDTDTNADTDPNTKLKFNSNLESLYLKVLAFKQDSDVQLELADFYINQVHESNKAYLILNHVLQVGNIKQKKLANTLLSKLDSKNIVK